MKRLSRPCYDKFHRCPGWAGGGMRHAKADRCPDGGYIRFYPGNGDYTTSKWWAWRFWPCDKCNVLVWPYKTRYLSPFYLRWRLALWIRDLRYRDRSPWC